MILNALTVKYETKVDVPGRYAHSIASLEATFEVEQGEGATATERAACYAHALHELKEAVLAEIRLKQPAKTPAEWEGRTGEEKP